MSRILHFYFDFISPFAYLAHQVLPDLARRQDCQLVHHVVDLTEIKRLAGNTGPTSREQPLKTRYLQVDKARWAKRYGVPCVTPASFDPTRLNRAMFYALDRDCAGAFVTQAWHLVWGKGGDMAAPGLLSEVAGALGWNADDVLRFAESPAAVDRYARSTREAHERGVFGVPTMVVGEDMWWGNDRIEFLDEHLTAGRIRDE